MKKLLTVVFTMLLAGSLSFAQNTAGDNKDAKKDDQSGKTATSDKPAEKEHKGGKKHKAKKDDQSKKGASDTATTPAPPK